MHEMNTIDPRFDRQRVIPGWRQDRLERASIAVYGRGWVGTFLVWGLASLGVGTIRWVGRPESDTQLVASALLARRRFGKGVSIQEYPFDVEYGPELGWALAGIQPDVMIACRESAAGFADCHDYATSERIPLLCGTSAGGGWFGRKPDPGSASWPKGSGDPVAALAVAAVLIDAAREQIFPLGHGQPADGALGLAPPIGRPTEAIAAATLIGAGGVGVYLATALAAALGSRLDLEIVDFDRVEISNLNRQGLFTEHDARHAVAKAEAARRVLSQWFPASRFTASVRRVGAANDSLVRPPDPAPRRVLLSAVDNAVSRIAIQDLGLARGVPVIQGGTSIHAADCFTQPAAGPTLDRQMHGALRAAAASEAQLARHAGCAVDPSYVVPGMIAAALMAHRFLHVPEGRAPGPAHWRPGCLPVLRSDPNAPTTSHAHA
jgi:molybdopterin/thiamine biosynthesis adenylyltransferase